jgi:hypothetical protein
VRLLILNLYSGLSRLIFTCDRVDAGFKVDTSRSYTQTKQSANNYAPSSSHLHKYFRLVHVLVAREKTKAPKQTNPKRQRHTFAHLSRRTKRSKNAECNKQPLNHNRLQTFCAMPHAEMESLLLPEYSHNAKYSWRRLVILRENSHPRGTPMLGGSVVNRTRIADAPKEGLGATFDSRSGLTLAVRQAYF